MKILNRVLVVMVKGGVAFTFAGFIHLFLCPSVFAVALVPGDLVVADYNGSNGGPVDTPVGGRILKVDPTTGIQTMITWTGLLDMPVDVGIIAGGEIAVLDQDATGQIIKVNPSDGSQEVISQGNLFVRPMGMTVDAYGNIFVADQQYAGTGGIIKVDSVTGEQMAIASGGSIKYPSDVAIDGAGNLYVTSTPVGGGLSVIKIDPGVGTQTVVYSSAISAWYTGIVVDDVPNNIYVSEIYTYNGIFRIDPVASTLSVLSNGSPFQDPYGMDIELDGNLIVAEGNWWGEGRIIRVNPLSGATTLLSSGGLLVDPAGIEVYPTFFPIANHPPVLDPIGNKSGYEDTLLEFSVTASDPDEGDTLTLEADNYPSGATFTQTNGTSGTFTWTPTYDQSGNYEDIEFCVTDNGDPVEIDCELITITIGNINRPPTIAPIASLEVQEYDLVEFLLTATDPDNDPVDVYPSTTEPYTMPAGATFDEANGLFSWLPGYNQSGTHIVRFIADDGNLTGELDVTITVNDIPPTALNDEIIDAFTNDMVLPQEVVNSYIANLKKVDIFIENGKVTPAINQLNAFINKVTVDVAEGLLSATDGQMLINMANDILDKLNG